MRGDRPSLALARHCGVLAPPHARGSTLHPGAPAGQRPGSPACAGIDLLIPTEVLYRLRLPRMRGDRPAVPPSPQYSLSAPPHARGSTLRKVVTGPHAKGSPACAGIDLRTRPAPTRCSGLPRMRGDRPCARSLRARMLKAPPHARGSTRRGRWQQGPEQGSPACAGIDLSPARILVTVDGLPRMRGDRPPTPLPSLAAETAPPHARGSTPSRNGGRAIRCGSPACAGIDLLHRSGSVVQNRLPRMRGDRPVTKKSTPPRSGAPPHARGSTPPAAPAFGVAIGSPACAGIDPSTCRRRASLARLPRMRGDRPAAILSIVEASKAPPHARGSTLIRRWDHQFVRGSPACAGIDPPPIFPQALIFRLPRMRGDRPSRLPHGQRHSRAPPHARGSTRRLVDF